MWGHGHSLPQPALVAPIRPARALLASVESQRERSPSSALSLLAGVADLVVSRVVSGFAPADGSSNTLDELDPQFAVETVERASGFTLRPHYDVTSLAWLLEMTRRRAVGGCFRAAMVKDVPGGPSAGSCTRRARRTSAWFSIALDGHDDMGLNAAVRAAADRGLALLRGAVDGSHLQSYDDNRCLLKGDASLLVHSRRPDLFEAFSSGRVLFTLLDGGGWMMSNLVA